MLDISMHQSRIRSLLLMSVGRSKYASVLVHPSGELKDINISVSDEQNINAHVAFDANSIEIHVTSLAASLSDSELLGIIAHEIGHACANHRTRWIKFSVISVFSACGIFAAVFTNSAIAMLLLPLATALIGHFGYASASQFSGSRKDEYEADRIAAEIAGVDGLISLFSRFSSTEEPSFWGTHPTPSERIEAIRRWRTREPS